MDTGEFREIQRFNQWWVYLLLFMPVLFFLAAVLLPVHDAQGQAISFRSIAIQFAAGLLLILWFLCLRLITTVNKEGISVRFSGIPFGRKRIAWSEVQSAHIVTYSPLRDYGGWGLRYSFSKGWCYNVKGKTGLGLVLKSGRRLMIGTQQQQLLQQTITLYFHP